MLNLKIFYELMSIKDVKSILELSRKTKIPYTTLKYMIAGHDMHVSSLIELSKFFNVPIDHLINKYYGITGYKEDKIINYSTSNIYEATLSSMM